MFISGLCLPYIYKTCENVTNKKDLTFGKSNLNNVACLYVNRLFTFLLSFIHSSGLDFSSANNWALHNSRLANDANYSFFQRGET